MHIKHTHLLNTVQLRIFSRPFFKDAGFHLPLQVIYLFVLVVLLILHFPKDVQQAVHLSLGLPRILFVASHFLFEVLNALG